MTRVATGLPTGVKLTEFYGGGRKKKIFVYLPSATVTSTSTSGTFTNPSTSPSASTSTVTSTFTSTITSTSILPSTFTTVFTTSTPIAASSSTVVSTSIIASTSTVTSTITPTSTVTSMSTITSTSTSTSSSTSSHAPTSSSTGTSSQHQVAMVDLTTPPTNGASTRRYLAALANNATRLTVDVDTSDSDSDWDSNVSGQMTIRPASSVTWTSSLRPVVTAQTGTGHQRAQREPRIYGYVTDDFSTSGAATDENVVSRTTETLKCLEALEVDGQNATLPFLTHSFEEFIWQGTEDTAVMVAILLQLSMPEDQLRKLITMLNNTTTACRDCYLWIADFDSVESEKVKLKYGLKGRDCTLLVLAPSHSRNMPQCVETFDDSNLEEDSLLKAMRMARDFCSAIKDERKKLEAWRLERQLQVEALKCAEQNEGQEEDEDDEPNEHDMSKEEDEEQDNRTEEEDGSKEEEPNERDNKLEEEDEEPDDRTEEENRSKEEEDEIRKARRDRCGDVEVTAGHTIRVRTKDGVISRMFAFGAHYQEVYDWVGGKEEMPLHFTLHRGDVVLHHHEKLSSDEALNITEREEREATLLLNSQVSFKGNLPQANEKLSSTLVDAPQKNKRDEKEHKKEVRKSHVDSQAKESGQKVKGNEQQKGKECGQHHSQAKDSGQKVKGNEQQKGKECGQQETGSNDGDQKADKSSNKRKKKKEKRSTSQRKKAKKEGQTNKQNDGLANTASN